MTRELIYYNIQTEVFPQFVCFQISTIDHNTTSAEYKYCNFIENWLQLINGKTVPNIFSNSHSWNKMIFEQEFIDQHISYKFLFNFENC